MKKLLSILLLFHSFISVLSQTVYDSTFNYVDKKNVGCLVGQTLLISDLPQYREGFTNLFWSNKKGKIYKSKGGKTPYKAVAGLSFKVVELSLTSSNPILGVFIDDGSKLFINYYVNELYYPFVIKGYIDKQFGSHVGFSYFLDKTNNDKIDIYRDTHNNIKYDIYDTFSQWSCVAYRFYDDTYKRECLDLYNKDFGHINIPLNDFKQYFCSVIDSSIVSYYDSLSIAYKLVEERFINNRDSDRLKGTAYADILNKQYVGKKLFLSDNYLSFPFGSATIIDSIRAVDLTNIKIYLSSGGQTISKLCYYYIVDDKPYISESFFKHFVYKKEHLKTPFLINDTVSLKDKLKKIRVGYTCSDEVMDLLGTPTRSFNSYFKSTIIKQWYYDSLGLCFIFSNDVLDNVTTYPSF